MRLEETLESFFLFITSLGEAAVPEAASPAQINCDQIKVASILIETSFAPS
jgi:hypothetical protein